AGGARRCPNVPRPARTCHQPCGRCPRADGGTAPRTSHLSPAGPAAYNDGFNVAAFPAINPSEDQAVLFADVPWYSHALHILVLLISIFLILLILIQRGKGGGLAGAFGGVGGSSAFGSRAGDIFTRVTLGVAAVWIILIMIQVKVVQQPGQGPENAVNMMP